MNVRIGSAALLLPAFLFVATGSSIAQDTRETVHSENDTIAGYPDSHEIVTPNDVEADLNASFPQPGALFGEYKPAGKYWTWKQEIFEKIRLKFAVNYTAIAQVAPQSHMVSDTATNWGAGGWLQLEAQWTFREDRNFEGNLTVVVDWRHAYGANTVLPGDNFQSNGSHYGTDGSFVAWDIYFQQFFWQQHFRKDKLWIRVGNIAVPGILDFNRFKDSRVAFTNTNFAPIPVHVLPAPPPGLGAGFRWNLTQDIYIAGAVQDINIVGGDVDWGSLFEFGEVFAGLEFGKNWRRGPGDFDHAHILLFYADKVSGLGVTIQDQFIPWPTTAGWGFKVLGEKQWNQLVVHGNYTYNTSEGGHVGVFTSANHALQLGLAYLRPLNTQGELGLKMGLSNINPNRVRMVNDPQDPSEAIYSAGLWNGFARDETTTYGAEAYWKILMLSDLWVTPGVQLLLVPTFNDRTDVILAPSLKARVFF